jgi:ferredoxin
MRGGRRTDSKLAGRDRRCAHCGDAFEPYRADHRYCSAACRMDAWLLRRAEAIRERKGGRR